MHHMGENYCKEIDQRIPEENALKQCFDRMSEEDPKMFVRLFEIAYLLAKKARPYSDFPDCLEMEAR